MKILLIKPAADLDTILKQHPIMLLEPLELGYLAAAAGADHETKALDLRLSGEPETALLETLSAFTPDLVGFTAHTHEADTVRRLARRLKERLPGATVVVGGHHATILPAEFNVPQVDMIVRGEGSLPFGEIVRRLAAGRSCQGISKVLITGTEFNTDAATLPPAYPDLDELPPPRRDLWDHRSYTVLWQSERLPSPETIFPATALVRSSHGCNMNCSFCVIPKLTGRRHLIRDPEMVADEIGALDADHVYFCDDETFLNPDRVRDLATVIQRHGITKRYFAWARSTSVNRHPDLFAQWSEIGLDTLFLGYESINNTTLKGWNKGATLAEHERAHRWLRDAGIATNAAFMLNSDFTAEDFDALADYIRTMPPAGFNITVCTPAPGSPDWERDKDRFICDPYAMHDCIHSLTPTRLPLKEFYDRYADLILLGSERSLLRQPGYRPSSTDLVKIARATRDYAEAVRNAYRDYA
jgi:radical SAM superfamily enzyme YgiQ (UPF0313 family)